MCIENENGEKHDILNRNTTESIAARRFQFSMLSEFEIATPIFHFSTRFMIAIGNRTNAVELKRFQNHKFTQKSLYCNLGLCIFELIVRSLFTNGRPVGWTNIVTIECELIWTRWKYTHTILDAFMTNSKSKLLLMIFSVLVPFRNGRFAEWFKIKVFVNGFFGKNFESYEFVMELTSSAHSKIIIQVWN